MQSQPVKGCVGQLWGGGAQHRHVDSSSWACRLLPLLPFWSKGILRSRVSPCCLLLPHFHLPVKWHLVVLSRHRSPVPQWDGDSGAGMGMGLLPAHAFLCHPGDQLPKPCQATSFLLGTWKTPQETPGRTKSPILSPRLQPSAALPGKAIKGVSEIS